MKNKYYYTDDGYVKFNHKHKYIVELDITTRCNLACNNCVKLSNFKHTWSTMSMDNIKLFINSIKGKDVLVKIIGGEPTIHKDIDDIILLIASTHDCILVTNGINEYKPPIDIPIENSAKIKNTQPEFHTFMEAPIDLDEYKDCDFSKGCSIADDCGYGYKDSKYYACPIAPHIPIQQLVYSNIDDVEKAKPIVFSSICKYCGMFKKLGYHNKDKTKLKRTTDLIISKWWKSKGFNNEN